MVVTALLPWKLSLPGAKVSKSEKAHFPIPHVHSALCIPHFTFCIPHFTDTLSRHRSAVSAVFRQTLQQHRDIVYYPWVRLKTGINRNQPESTGIKIKCTEIIH